MDWRELDGIIHDFIEWLLIFWIDYLRMEEHLWCQESFVAYSDPVLFLCYFVLSGNILVELFHQFFIVHTVVVVLEFLDEVAVLNNIAEFLFNRSRDLGQLFYWELFSPFLNHIGDHACDVGASKRDMFNAATNNVAVRNWDDVSNTISCVDHCSRQAYTCTFFTYS